MLEKETDKSSGLSVEVIGRLTPEQQVDWLKNVAQIADRLGWNLQDVEKRQQAFEIVRACVEKALVARGKTWVGKDERVTPYFLEGLQLRAGIVGQFQQATMNSENYKILSDEELDYLGQTSALSSQFDETEQIYSSIQKRRREVTNFVQELIYGSSLETQARVVSLSITHAAASEYALNDRLMATLAIHLAIHQSPGLYVSADDVALLSELWGQDNIRKATLERLRNYFKAMATHLKFSDLAAIENYTGWILNKLQTALLNEVTVQGVHQQDLIIIQEMPELVQDSQTEELDTLELNPNQLIVAQLALEELFKRRRLIREVAQSSDDDLLLSRTESESDALTFRDFGWFELVYGLYRTYEMLEQVAKSHPRVKFLAGREDFDIPNLALVDLRNVVGIESCLKALEKIDGRALQIKINDRVFDTFPNREILKRAFETLMECVRGQFQISNLSIEKILPLKIKNILSILEGVEPNKELITQLEGLEDEAIIEWMRQREIHLLYRGETSDVEIKDDLMLERVWKALSNERRKSLLQVFNPVI